MKTVTLEIEKKALIDNVHCGVGSHTTFKTSAGHAGERTIIYRLSGTHYWPGMADDIRAFIASCESCQKKKTRNLEKPKRELHPIPIPLGKQWSQIGIDLMTMKCVNGYNYVLSVIDYYTKWVEFIPCQTKTAQEISYHIWTLMLRHGAPEIIITDQGREFQNDVSKELYRFTNTKHRVTAAYHPQVIAL